MKKKVLPFVIIISAFTVIVSVMIIEKNNKTPVERYLDTSQTVENSINEPSAELYVSITTDDSSIVSEVEDTRSERVSCTILNTTHTVQYEFLLYEIIDDVDIASQMKYAGDYFYSGTLPDPDYLVEYTDYPAMRKDYPEVDEYISSNGEKGMTAAEYQAFLNQHLDEYTTSFHPKTKYLFLKCRISNVSNGSVIEYINDLRIIMMNEGNIIGIPTEFNCYFDHSQNTTGDERIHNYLQYKFEPGETIECVIGCAIREDPRFEMDLSKEYSYYIGFLPIGLDNLNQLNPSIDEGFVLLDSLQKEA
jgi:hypothetical protein